MTALSKEERAGLVAEIAEVEAEIKRLDLQAQRSEESAALTHWSDMKLIHQRSARFCRGKTEPLRARLADLKRREASA